LCTDIAMVKSKDFLSNGFSETMETEEEKEETVKE
jgi:hypothetical protein